MEMTQTTTHPKKPLGIKNSGSIGHLPNSRMGEGDHKCPDGQARIATLKTRDKHDRIIVQEKLDCNTEIVWNTHTTQIQGG
jgi:hypothetical protein